MDSSLSFPGERAAGHSDEDYLFCLFPVALVASSLTYSGSGQDVFRLGATQIPAES